MSLLVFFICCIIFLSIISGREAASTRCIERERKALMQFKNAFVDDYGLISSWGRDSQDCCLWRGVGCSNTTNDVIMLDLHGYWSADLNDNVGFRGDIDPSLLELNHLQYLDLSLNSFTRIPNFIGSFKELRYLNLSFIGFMASGFPPQLGNLSYLKTLDLSSYYNVLKNTNWIYKLSSLEYLSLDGINLSDSDHNPLVKLVTRLPSLIVLNLHDCRLNKVPANFSLPIIANFSKSLSTLDISSNNLPPSFVYPWLFNFSGSLTNIDLSYNELVGTIPDAFGAFDSLQTLNLASNELEGSIPRSFGNLSNLHSLYLSWNNLKQDLHNSFQILSGPAEKSIQVLDLSWNEISGSLIDFTTFTSLKELHLGHNELNGSFPERFEKYSNLFVLDLTDNKISGLLPDLSPLSSLRKLYIDGNHIKGTLGESIMSLSELQFLGVSSNMLQGTISESHLRNLSRLVYLDLSYNSLVLELGSDWFPTFSLDVVLLSSCNLGPSFPTWLQTQKNFSIIDISNAQINDLVPNWFWEQLNPSLRYMNLSSNQIHGTIPDLMYGNYPHIDLSSNTFSGPIPSFPPDTLTLLLYKNVFSGSVSFLCNFTSISHLDISNNQLSGKLPDCWRNLRRSILFLNLENNKFSGRIPTSMGALSWIDMLSLRNNNFTGELPYSFKKFTSLTLLDVGENKISGPVPVWIGKSLVQLRVLSLPANMFHGTIPTSFCKLSMLQILDLSVNNISGTIPECLGNLQGMATRKTEEPTISTYSPGLAGDRLNLDQIRYQFKAFLQWKGRKSEYNSTLGLVVSLDLSSNAITGPIPENISNLFGLVALNLSRNNLTLKIPQDIGRLRWLDFLDLSRNHLVGGIPTSLSQLSNLGVLDLSNNNLSGRIPVSTQLQSFDASSYVGNPALCGLPLPNACPGDVLPLNPQTTVDTDNVGDDQDNMFDREFFISLLIGLAFGFWGICGTLVVKDSWRYAYFEFLASVKDWIYVVITVNYARLKRRSC